jgi:hypothetical protein
VKADNSQVKKCRRIRILHRPPSHPRLYHDARLPSEYLPRWYRHPKPRTPRHLYRRSRPHRQLHAVYRLSSRTRKVVNRAANAFRLAAQSLANSRTALGGFYRRIRTRSGAPKAITATAHKLRM